jgi:hypothetical protein
VAALTGTAREAPTLSKVIASCCGTPGTTLQAGRVASVQPLGSRFQSAATKTIAALTAWQQSTAYNVGDRVTADGKAWQCTIAGTSLGSGSGPAGNPPALVADGTVTWVCFGVGTGAVDVQFNAQTYGPIIANAGTLNKIETPTAGWSTVRNAEDAYYLGTNLESDAAMRLRREAELRAQGNAMIEAIRQSVLAVAAVTGCYVFENTTDATDANGLPPHSVEAVVQGGDNAAIREALFASVAGGINTYGTSSGSVTDARGQLHTIRFTRPMAIPVYVTFDLVVDANSFPIDGVDQVKAAALAFGTAAYVNGRDVVASALGAQAFKVPGVLDCPAPKIGTAPAPGTSTTIPISLHELAQLDSARIVVNTTPGTP